MGSQIITNNFFMFFFDCLFYTSCKFYEKYKEKGAESTGASIVGGLQGLNLLSLYFLYLVIRPNAAEIGDLSIIGVFILLQITSHIRYLHQKKHSIKEIEIKWLRTKDSVRKRIITFLYIYVIISTIAVLALAGYLGERDN